jgi:hypothetical protein
VEEPTSLASILVVIREEARCEKKLDWFNNAF